MVWPSIATPNDIEDVTTKPVKRQKSSAGYVMSYAGATISKRMFILSWSRMYTADKELLEIFFEVNAGGSFSWTSPLTSTVYTMMFAQDQIRFKHHRGAWKSTVILEEA